MTEAPRWVLKKELPMPDVVHYPSQEFARH
jgi:hypothetical protein